MSKPTKENVATVMDGLNQFYEHMIQTKSFNIKEFVDFMEPKFKAAGYRDEDKTIRGGNILLLTEIGAGDFIVTTGAIREIRRIYPDARITLVVSPRTLELAECCPYVDEIIVNPQKVENYNPFEVFKMSMEFVAKLLEQRFDICFAFSIHPHTPLLSYMSGARIRVITIDHESMNIFNKLNGLTEYFTRLSTHIFPYNNYGYHRADRYFSLLENFLHLPITNRKMEIWYTPADIGIAKNYLKGSSDKIYSLCMGGVYLKKHYPPESYAKLLEMILRKEQKATFVILGGGQADLHSAEIIKNIAPKIYEKNIIDLTNKVNYRHSAAVLSLCDMYIGNDTGTMHLAAAVSCPVLTPNCFATDLHIRNNDTPARWYPYNVPCIIVQPTHALPECKNLHPHHMYGCAANFPHCITQIKPETIYRGFKLLKERAAKKLTEPLFIH